MEHFENFFDFLASLNDHVRQRWITYFRNQMWAPAAVVTIQTKTSEEMMRWDAANVSQKYAHMQYGDYHMFCFQSTKEAVYFKVVWQSL